MTKEEKLQKFKEHVKNNAECRELGLIQADGKMHLTNESFKELVPSGSFLIVDWSGEYIEITARIDDFMVITLY
jgi:hypothetical protein